MVDTLTEHSITWTSVSSSPRSRRWMAGPSSDALCSGCDVGQFRDEEAFSRLAFDGFTAPVIALGRGHSGMACQTLHGGDIRSGVQQVADVGPTQVVRAEAFPSLQLKH